MTRRILPVVLATLLLSACGSLLTPQYERPNAPVPESWPTRGAYENAAKEGQTAAIDTGWHDFILDERLRKLVKIALDNNRDLRISALNMEKARAAYGISRADMFPAVSAAGAATHAKGARDVVGDSSNRISHQYNATLGFSNYELDFFGKIQNQAEASREAWLQLIETRDTAQITLVSQVISGYLTLAADQERLKIAKDTFASLQNIAHINFLNQTWVQVDFL